MFKTEEELLAFFRDGGCMVDTDTGEVYVSDVNLDGDFFGIFMSEPVPEDARHDHYDAIQWAYCVPMNEYSAPGCWFSELAEEVLANPGRFTFGDDE